MCVWVVNSLSYSLNNLVLLIKVFPHIDQLVMWVGRYISEKTYFNDECVECRMAKPDLQTWWLFYKGNALTENTE